MNVKVSSTKKVPDPTGDNVIKFHIRPETSTIFTVRGKIGMHCTVRDGDCLVNCCLDFPSTFRYVERRTHFKRKILLPIKLKLLYKDLLLWVKSDLRFAISKHDMKVSSSFFGGRGLGSVMIVK